MNKWNDENLFDFVFNDQTTLIWSRDKQTFLHLNQHTSWVYSCLHKNYSEPLIVQLLVDEQTLSEADAKELVHSLSDPDLLFNSPQQNPVHSISESFTFPFVEITSGNIVPGNHSKNLFVRLGGITIRVSFFSDNIDIVRVTRSFVHEDCTHENPESLSSINIGIFDNGRLWAACDATGGFYANDEDELTTLIYWMLYKTVESAKDWLIALHAGGVQYGDKAIIISGPGGSGKSTLTVALTQKLGTYLTDELIVISRYDHLIWPVPTLPCLKKGSWDVTKEIYPILDTVEPMKRLDRRVKFLPISENITVPESIKADNAFLIFPTFAETTTPPAIRSLTIGETIDIMIKSGCLFGEFKDQNDFRDFANWLGKLRCFKIEYNSTEQGLRLIEDVIAL